MTMLQTIQVNQLAFEYLERGEGTPVVMLHGFPDNLLTFRHQLDCLASQGFRAISLSLRGYHPASQDPQQDYYVSTLADDVLDLLDAMGLGRVHLVGHDWGAIVGMAAAAKAPLRFYSLSSLAVPHLGQVWNMPLKVPRQLLNSWYILAFQTPRLPELALRQNHFHLLERIWTTWSPDWDLPKQHLDSVKHTFAHPGVIKAALQYYRCLLNFTARKNYESWSLLRSALKLPCLFIIGAQDQCLRAELFHKAMHQRYFPHGLKTATIEDAGHFFHLERPERVNQVLLEWLGQHQ